MKTTTRTTIGAARAERFHERAGAAIVDRW